MRTMGARAVLVSVMLALGGCAAGVGPEPAPAPKQVCPDGQRYEGDFEHCVYVDAPKNAVGKAVDCHPVTCQVYLDWSMYGDGGVGAGWCSAACDSHCQGDGANEVYSLAQAKLAGTICDY